MNNIQCFKIKPDTEYDNAVKQHFALLPKWKYVYDKVSELLGENITKIGYSIQELYIDVSELQNDENKKLFKKDGTLKGNLKKAKEILSSYKKLLLKSVY